MANILIVDDDVTFCLMLKKLLEKNHYQVTTVYSPGEVRQLLREMSFDIVLTDLRMPSLSGMDLIRMIRLESPKTRIIMMTGYADIATAIQSIKQGAFNYIPKPFLPEEVLAMISEALDEAASEPEEPMDNDSTQSQFLAGESAVSGQLQELIALVAPTPLSVLITGESGTGKEYVARSIHALSTRADQPFIAVDCGAIPAELVASEFFGHVKGSFTGAVADKTGHFEAAKGGTLFLDEVGNLSYNTQIQLLRTLQERLIKPVGSSREIPVDVRIIAATNENLQTAQEKGNFREDLFHRLNEFQIRVPSLRERGDDILLFGLHFLKQANSVLKKSVTGFDRDVLKVFKEYTWPGNLREMKNVIKRATLLSQGNEITLHEIPEEIYSTVRKDEQFALYNEETERGLILRVLKEVGFNKSKAARVLKIDRKTLYNKLKLYNIELPQKDGFFSSN